MQPSSPYRPRVSRETRSLLTAAVLAVAALWLLARVRFPERPVTANPVPSVLSQLASGPKYDDLAGEIAQLQTRLQPSLISIDAPPAAGSPQAAPRMAALRLREDLAVMLIPSWPNPVTWNGASVLSRDAASGLAVVRLPTPLPAPPPVPWTPRQLQQSRYLVATTASPDGVSLRPVFAASLDPIDSPLWSEPLWVVPGRTDLAPGSFLFTSTAELTGLVIPYRGGLAIVPGTTVLSEAERLLAAPPGPAGVLGIDVQDLTAPLASLTGASEGVVVTWVDPAGAGEGQLRAGDVIEAAGGRALSTRQHWDVRVARLSVGETLSLRVRRRGGTREVALVASAPAPPATNRSLGLTLRARPKIGAEVVRIDPGSAAHRAGLAPGDVITLIADIPGPTPAQVKRSFTSAAAGQRLMVAVTRGDAHFVTTVER